MCFVFFCLQGRKAEEQRAQRLSADFNQYRHDAERRLAEKDEEIEAIRWVRLLYVFIPYLNRYLWFGDWNDIKFVIWELCKTYGRSEK